MSRRPDNCLAQVWREQRQVWQSASTARSWPGFGATRSYCASYPMTGPTIEARADELQARTGPM